jgi:hypothetical protein
MIWEFGFGIWDVSCKTSHGFHAVRSTFGKPSGKFLCTGLGLDKIRIPKSYIPNRFAEVAKLADAPDLGSGVERRASSSLALGTKTKSTASISRQ